MLRLSALDSFIPSFSKRLEEIHLHRLPVNVMVKKRELLLPLHLEGVEDLRYAQTWRGTCSSLWQFLPCMPCVSVVQSLGRVPPQNRGESIYAGDGGRAEPSPMMEWIDAGEGGRQGRRRRQPWRGDQSKTTLTLWRCGKHGRRRRHGPAVVRIPCLRRPPGHGGGRAEREKGG